MLKIATLLFVLGCLTLTSALNATLTNSLFFINQYNQLSYKLLHTSNGIHAYSVETGPATQYLLLDPQSGFVTPILSELMDACGHKGAVVFDRLHYHVLTSTLVYYCTANNSLLVLDETNYTVQANISTQLNET